MDLGVADVAAQLRVDLARIRVVPPPEAAVRDPNAHSLIPDLRRRVQSETLRAERLNALRASDIRLQRAGPAYATRSGANNAHFLLARRPDDLRMPSEGLPLYAAALQPAPVPGLGSMQRFRAELGPFLGLAGAIDMRGIDGGFESTQTARGGSPGSTCRCGPVRAWTA